MEGGQIAAVAGLGVIAITHGVVSVVLVGKKNIPIALRMVPFVLGALIFAGGFLGTVIGLQMAFGAVASADASTKASLLAQGISEAMNWTALSIVYGIAFAIGAVAGLITSRRSPARPGPAAPPP